MNHQLSDNQNYFIRLSADINLYSTSPKKNKNYFLENNRNFNSNMKSNDIDILLNKTQNSIDEFITTLTNEPNIPKQFYKKIAYNKEEIQTKTNKNKINHNKIKDINIQNIFNYDKDLKNIIETQRKLLGNNKEKYKTKINDVPLKKNRRASRRYTNTDNFDINYNVNKTKDIKNGTDKQVLINSFSKQKLNKRDISALENNQRKNNEKSYDNKSNNKIINYENIIGIYNKKNKLLIKENENYKKEINNLKILLKNLQKENIKLNQELETQINKNKNSYNNMSISQQNFTIINKKTIIKNKELISSLKKEIKYLKEQLNNYKNKEYKKINIDINQSISLPVEHDINIDQIEKLKKENNDLDTKNIYLIEEIKNLKKNQNFILANNFLDKKNKSLNNQITYLKNKLKNYNNLQAYIKLYLRNKSNILNEKEEIFIRKIKDELDYIQEKSHSSRGSLQSNNYYFLEEINDDIYNVNEKI